MEAFLAKLSGSPNQINDSRLRTLSLSVDVLGSLMRGPALGQEQLPQSVAVVLDAERVSCTAASNALHNAGFNPSKFSDPAAALAHLSTTPVDLVVLDMTAAQKGFDLYNKLRELPLHQETPVVFVTNTSDTKRPPGMLANSETQFLAKPYNMISYLELALKALSRVLKFRASHSPIPAVPSSVSSPASVPAQDQGHSGWPSEGADCSKEETTSPAIDDSGSASAK